MATLLEKDETGSLLKPDVTSSAVLEQLDRILQSEPFRNSKRHPRFLRFVVGKLLDRSADQVKERIIGIEVFDRAVDYDASTDPIVRVAAGEIRKRLAQYYLVDTHAMELRFELHAGSYLPTIYWPGSENHTSSGIAGSAWRPHVRGHSARSQPPLHRVARNDAEEELYDYSTDPHESVNLAHSAAYAARKQQLREELDRICSDRRAALAIAGLALPSALRRKL